MSWRDRNYNRSSNSSEFFSNPLGVFNLSAPFGTWFGARVRLSFWLFLTIILNFYVPGIRSGDLITPTLETVFLLIALLVHEFGHRLMARFTGGSHDEFLLWPAGGMIPPNAPPYPGKFFLTHVGGIFANLVTGALCVLVVSLLSKAFNGNTWNPLSLLMGATPFAFGNALNFTVYCLTVFGLINFGLIIANLLPYYWFDGAYLLQAILWPFIKHYQAVNVTCIIGMVLAVPMFGLSLLATSFFGMIFWALLFADSFNRRRQLKAAGPQEEQDAIAWSASLRDEGPTRHRKVKKGWFRHAKKRALQEAAEQAKIDAILEKVHNKGLHSLSWWEKRTLRKATERQRQRDLAERL